jgi:predicted metal-dependent peptidase
MTTDVAKRSTATQENGTPDTSPQMTAWPVTTKTDEQVLDYLIRARVKLLISAPFFGTIATRLKFIDASKWCPTAATDGKNFYYNKDFVAALQDKEEEQVVFLVGHEVLHCVYDHMDKTRLGKRDHQLWNIANDYVINNDLVEANVGNKIDLVQICFEYKYRNMMSEEVYDDLFRQAEEEGRVFTQQTLDVHLDGAGGEGEGDEANGNAPGEKGNDGSTGPIKYNNEELEQISNDMQSAVLQSAKAAGGAGNIPNSVKRLINDLLNPQLDWQELLAMQIQSVIKSNYTYLNPSRKGMDAGIYLPGMDYAPTIDIALALDMSGSIQDDMAREMLSEVKGIMEQYTNFKIHLFCFDTEVHNPQVFTESNMDEFMEYELGGGGGTDFEVCWNYLKEEGIVPQKFVMFTDGYPWDSWGDENYCDTLFIVHGDGYGGQTPTAPFGTTVPYKREA